MNYVYRNLTKEIEDNIKTRPITYLNGGRQVGKSTLCLNLSDNIDVNQITFDSPIALSSAKSDPATFIASLPDNTLNIIDEVQFAPEIFTYLKMQVDKNRTNDSKQKFLLTGSANLMALPNLSEALVGRMSVLTLYPFSAAEYYNTNVSLIDKLFNVEIRIKNVEPINIIDVIKNCTYPEISIDNTIDRIKWFDNYLTTILNRDIKSLSDLKKPETMVTLLSVLSMRAGGLLNNTSIAKEIGIDYRTYEKMLAFAMNSFMVFNIKPWAKPNNLNIRFIKSPKFYFTDCNFLSYIIKRDIATLYENDKKTFGNIFENFIASELIKQAKINNIELSHFRTQVGKEADFVLENTNGDIVGIEVKSSKSIDKKYLSGLTELQNICGESFKRGFIVYLGNEILPVGDKIWAVPASYLWT